MNKVLNALARSVWFRLAIIMTVTIAGALWLYHKGPTPVIKGSTTLPIMVPFWYMLLAFPVLGMLVADLYAISFVSKPGAFELAIQIIILVVLSNIRLASAIPISGHSLLLGYFIVRRSTIRFQPSVIPKLEFITALIILAAVAYMKLNVWIDPMTFFIGLVIGGVLALISFLIWKLFYTKRLVVETGQTSYHD